jgi:hypothetical protein
MTWLLSKKAINPKTVNMLIILKKKIEKKKKKNPIYHQHITDNFQPVILKIDNIHN